MAVETVDCATATRGQGAQYSDVDAKGMRFTCVASAEGCVAIGASGPNALFVLSQDEDELIGTWIDLRGISVDESEEGPINSVCWHGKDRVIVAMLPADEDAEDSQLLVVDCRGGHWSSPDASICFTKTIVACTGLDMSPIYQEASSMTTAQRITTGMPFLMSASVPAWEIAVTSHALSVENQINLIHFTDGEEGVAEVEVDDDRYAVRVPDRDDGNEARVAGLGMILHAGQVKQADAKGASLPSGSPIMCIMRNDGRLLLASFASLYVLLLLLGLNYLLV